MTRRKLLAGGAAVLSAQGAASLALSRSEYLPSPPPLSGLPPEVGEWVSKTDLEIDPAAIEMLGPDDVLSRLYESRTGDRASLFVAYYKTQHRARNAHDPKVCLPGSGWETVESTVIPVPLRGSISSIPVNLYVVQKQSAQNVVLYWFQNHKRAIAYEQLLKFDRLLDSIRENRTDMALVRVTVPVSMTVQPARDAGIQFIQSLYPYIMGQFTAG
jgi:EpsI family protein